MGEKARARTVIAMVGVVIALVAGVLGFGVRIGSESATLANVKVLAETNRDDIKGVPQILEWLQSDVSDLKVAAAGLDEKLDGVCEAIAAIDAKLPN